MKAHVQIRRIGKPSQIKVLDYEENYESKWVAGRHSKCDIYTGSKYASRKHFSIFYKDGNFFIYDHGTANGTSLNNVELSPEQEYPLKLNDRINVGPTPSSLKGSDRDLFIFEKYKGKGKKSRESGSETLRNALEPKKKRKENIPRAKEKNYNLNTERKSISAADTVNRNALQVLIDIASIYPIDRFEKCSEVCLVQNGITEDFPITYPEEFPKENKISSQNNYKIADNEHSVQVNQEVPDPVDSSINEDSTVINEDSTVINENSTVIVKKEVESPDDCFISVESSTNSFGSIERHLSETEKSVSNEIIFEDPLPENEVEIFYSNIYSNTGELIEINDSDDETYQGLGTKTDLSARNCTVKVEEEDEDSKDVVFLDNIIKNKKSNFDNITEIRIEDDEDFSETDRKWIGKLLNRKEERKSLTQDMVEGNSKANKEKEEEDESWIEHVMLCAEDINRILECEKKKAERKVDECNKDVEVEDVIEIDDKGCKNIQVIIEKQKELCEASSRERVRKRSVPENCKEINAVPVKKVKKEDIKRILECEEKKPDLQSDECKKDNVSIEDVIEIDDEGWRNIQIVTEKPKEEKVFANRSSDLESKILKPPSPDVARENGINLFAYGIPCGFTKSARKAAKRKRAKERRKTRARLGAVCPASFKQISNSLPKPVIRSKKSGNSIPCNGENKLQNCLKLNDNKRNMRNVVAQEIKKPLKSSLKKYGCSFMKSYKPLTARKTVTFGANRTIVYETDNRISRVTSNLKCKKFSQKRTIFKVISQICCWNAVWLEESKRAGLNELPEYFHASKLRRVEKKYKNHVDYMRTFIPLILLDIWYTISEKWQKFGSKMCQMSVMCKSYVELPQSPLAVLGCVCIDFPNIPKDGDLVTIHLPKKNIFPGDPRSGGVSGSILLFGFIHSRKVEYMDAHSFHPKLDGPFSNRDTVKLIKLNILVLQNSCFPEYMEQVVKITLLHNVSLELFACQSICDLYNSPLCSAILGPNVMDMNLKGPMIPDKMSCTETLDFEQRLLITKIAFCCTNISSGLMLIQGGAGTGKTHMMKVLVIHLLTSFTSKRAKPPKILYCSHSSLVVDEMALKLENYRRFPNQNVGFKVFHFRDLQHKDPTVQDNSSYRMGENYEDYAQLGRRIGANMISKNSFDDADVMCITCAETESKMMIQAFEKLKSTNPDRKVICIVDGAMESNEAESIMPLRLGVTHLILVGDPRQLQPKTKNEVTRAFGSHQSLFWRVSSAFKTGEVSASPVYVLKTQYRMSRTIMKLISRIFYGSEFNNGYSDNLPRAFKEFIFFVDNAMTEFNSEEECGMRRINIGIMILDALMSLKREKMRNDSVAVITCREDQTRIFRYELSKRFPAEVSRDIEVNPVENVQGREFDLVLFLCDENMEIYFRANVAMTRAKRSLFVLSSSPFYQNNKILKKLGHEARHLNAFHMVTYNTSINEIKSIINFQ